MYAARQKGPLPLFTAPNSQQKAADFHSRGDTLILTWLCEIMSLRDPPASPLALGWRPH